MNPSSSDRNHADGGLTLRDAVALLRRRRWIVLACVVLVPLSAIGFSLMQQAQYEGQAEVLLSQQNLANSLTGVSDPSVRATDGDRIAQTQAKLATVPTIASRTLRELELNDRTTADLLEQVEVTTEQNSDILVFKVTDNEQALAGQLANEYARQYTKYRGEVDTAAVKYALEEVTARVEQLESSGDKNTELHATLVDKQQQLRTIEALQTANSFVVQREDLAEQVAPTPVRNAILGLVLGGLLGIGLAFARDAFDTRLRSPEQLADRIGLPLLARIPKPGSEGELPVMLTNPHGPAGETFRILRGNLEFSMLGRDIRTLMVTSSVEVEGKSTVIANLALALARGGRRVALVDLDLRRPRIDSFFSLKGLPGVTNVAIGAVSLDEACVSIPLEDGAPAKGANGNGAPSLTQTASTGSALGGSGDLGSLDVLPCGAIPPDPGEFVGTEPLAEIIAELRERYDIVLIDAPPMLRVGDPLTLAPRVDGIFVIARLGLVTGAMASELSRVLSSLPTTTLGVVATGAGEENAYAYAGYYGPYTRIAPTEQQSDPAQRVSAQSDPAASEQPAAPKQI